ncbi:hypothetical protein AKJ16_DCAP02289 [Drosera capensis]
MAATHFYPSFPYNFTDCDLISNEGDEEGRERESTALGRLHKVIRSMEIGNRGLNQRWRGISKLIVEGS